MENIMDNPTDPGKALKPEDLAAFFVERANAGDVEGVVALYNKEGLPASHFRMDG